MRNALRLAALLSIITLPSLAAAPARAEPLNVVASFSVIADFARNVGGERIALTTLVGPGGDAHVYEPKPADAAAMAKADVVLVNGLHFEGFLARLVESSATDAKVIELTKGVETIGMKEEEQAGEEHKAEGEGHDHDHDRDKSHAHDDAHHHHGDIDPHAFQAIANANIYVKNIAEAFCVADSEGCETYRANAETYGRELDALETEVRAGIAAIPPGKRVVITSHDAFGYFGHAYGIAFLAPQGISTEAEASAADVAKLVEQVRSEKASAVFVENVTNPRLIEQIAGETGLKVGGTLYSDALSGPDGPAATYADMMRHNVRTLKDAILGD